MRADLALIGFGHVGRRFARLLDEQRGRLQREVDLECSIVAIVTRHHGSAYDPDGLDAPALADIAERGGSISDLRSRPGPSVASGFEAIERLAQSTAPIRAMVETTTLNITDGTPAIEYVAEAIRRQCDAITANKGPVAFAYDRLRAAADAHGVSFLFEGAVMDGIPIFSLVRETMPAVRVLGFRGVINSTTNHILTALEEGETFETALARMQSEGIAEADPSLDADGWDAAAKAAALANVFFDAKVTPHDVARTGIGPATGAEARRAKARGNRLKLVAECAAGERPVVRPTELAGDDLLAGLRGTENALVLTTDLLGSVAICQLSGGLTQTAYALLSDLVTVRRRASTRAAAPARRIL